MKKVYKAPAIKVGNIRCSCMLSESFSDCIRFYDEEVSLTDDNQYYGDDGYNDGW